MVMRYMLPKACFFIYNSHSGMDNKMVLGWYPLAYLRFLLFGWGYTNLSQLFTYHSPEGTRMDLYKPWSDLDPFQLVGASMIFTVVI